MEGQGGTVPQRRHPWRWLVLALCLASCSTPLTTREKGALVGGAVGAGAGAAIGSASGNAGTGALIWAGVGVVSGALIGDAMQATESQPAAAPPPPPPPPPVSVAPPPPPPVSVRVDMQIRQRPALAVVPGTSVYYAPRVSYNYFAYNGRFYIYQQDGWFSARAYNGPWTALPIERVPRPILGVPVTYHQAPPQHWKQKHGPPPWAQAKGHAKQKWSDD